MILMSPCPNVCFLFFHCTSSVIGVLVFCFQNEYTLMGSSPCTVDVEIMVRNPNQG